MSTLCPCAAVILQKGGLLACVTRHNRTGSVCSKSHHLTVFLLVGSFSSHTVNVLASLDTLLFT